MFDTLVTLTVSAAFVVSLAAFAGFAFVRNASGRPSSRMTALVARAPHMRDLHHSETPTAVSDGALQPGAHRS